jgi:hypothetical protein
MSPRFLRTAHKHPVGPTCLRTVHLTHARAGFSDVVLLHEYLEPQECRVQGRRCDDRCVQKNGRFPARLLSTVRMGRPRSSPSLRGLGMPHSPVILRECGFCQMFAGSSQLMWVHSSIMWAASPLDSYGWWARKHVVIALGCLYSRAATGSDFERLDPRHEAHSLVGAPT